MSILSSIQLLLQQRVARKRGYLESNIFNATIAELSRDLISFMTPWNEKLVPLINSLPENAGNDLLDAVSSGLDSRVIFVNHSATSLIDPDNFNTTQNRPSSIHERIGELAQLILDLEQQVNNQIGTITVSASQVSITDSGNLYSATNVESALAEVRTVVNNIITNGFDLTAVDSNYIPVTDNFYDIGTPALRIKDLFLGPASLNVHSKVSDGANAVAKQITLGVDLGDTDPTKAGDVVLSDGTEDFLRVGTEFFEISKPLKLPSLSQTEIDALTPLDGLMVYNSSTGKLMATEGGSWYAVRSSATGGSGWIYIADITPTAGGVVYNRVWQDGAQTVLQSAETDTEQLTIHISAAYPKVDVNGTIVELSFDVLIGSYTGTENITLSGGGTVTVTVITPDGNPGAVDNATVTYNAPPQILSLSFTGGYPGIQTELKAGDTFQITGTSDQLIDAIEVQGTGASDSTQLILLSGGPATSFTETITIGQTLQGAQPASVKGRSSVNGGLGPARATNQAGGTTDGTDLVTLNNTHPSLSITGITYPASQGALKNAEVATVANSATNFDTITYSSPNGDLSVANPATFEASKSVSRIAGSYNISTPNIEISANRAANNATTTIQGVARIANVAATVNVLLPAVRLVSGGNDGTSVQVHTITAQADQELLNAPTLDVDGLGGTWNDPAFTNGPVTWVRGLQAHDTNHPKGIYTWQNLVATNLAGIITNAISSGSTYTLGGFVARNVVFPPLQQNSDINVPVITYTNLQAAGWSSKPGSPAIRHTPQGDQSDAVDEFTVLQIGASVTTVWWNDVTAAGVNSTGTAYLISLEELP